MAQISQQQQVDIRADSVELAGDLTVPVDGKGLVIFAHGSGSSRFSSRNRHVAEQLNDANLATLLFDLLTEDEERVDQFTRQHRFDIPMLAERLAATVDWAEQHKDLSDLRIGLFGASTGAAAALIAAAQRPEQVAAVVSRGGRPDLAGEHLPRVKAPTLLIVGGLDRPVIGMNESAAEQMTAPVRMQIVPGATHLFEEPGKLDEVSALARDWFVQHLANAGA